MNDFQVVLTILGLVLFMNWISKKFNFINQVGDGISLENSLLLDSSFVRPDLEPMRPIYEGNCNTGSKNDFLYSIIYIIVMISAGCLIYWITKKLAPNDYFNHTDTCTCGLAFAWHSIRIKPESKYMSSPY